MCRRSEKAALCAYLVQLRKLKCANVVVFSFRQEFISAPGRICSMVGWLICWETEL